MMIFYDDVIDINTFLYTYCLIWGQFAVMSNEEDNKEKEE